MKDRQLVLCLLKCCLCWLRLLVATPLSVSACSCELFYCSLLVGTPPTITRFLGRSLFPAKISSSPVNASSVEPCTPQIVFSKAELLLRNYDHESGITLSRSRLGGVLNAVELEVLQIHPYQSLPQPSTPTTMHQQKPVSLLASPTTSGVETSPCKLFEGNALDSTVAIIYMYIFF